MKRAAKRPPKRATQRATLIATTEMGERKLLDQWMNKWKKKLPYCSENAGCGCCVDLYEVEAPKEALQELPSHFIESSGEMGNIESK